MRRVPVTRGQAMALADKNRGAGTAVPEKDPQCGQRWHTPDHRSPGQTQRNPAGQAAQAPQ